MRATIAVALVVFGATQLSKAEEVQEVPVSIERRRLCLPLVRDSLSHATVEMQAAGVAAPSPMLQPSSPTTRRSTTATTAAATKPADPEVLDG